MHFHVLFIALFNLGQFSVGGGGGGGGGLGTLGVSKLTHTAHHFWSSMATTN